MAEQGKELIVKKDECSRRAEKDRKIVERHNRKRPEGKRQASNIGKQ